MFYCVYIIHICIFTYIPKYKLINLFSVTLMHVFSDK